MVQQGIEPSESDIEWHLLLDELIEHAKNNQWGLYSNTILRMAEHLYKLKEFDQSLRKYLNVLYLDINGPNNVSFLMESRILMRERSIRRNPMRL